MQSHQAAKHKKTPKLPNASFIFTPESPELRDSKNLHIKAMREADWLVVMRPSKGQLYLDMSRIAVYVNGKSITQSPHFDRIKDEVEVDVEAQDVFVRHFILDEWFQFDEASAERNTKKIEKIIRFWNQSLMDTAKKILQAIIKQMNDCEEFGHHQTSSSIHPIPNECWPSNTTYACNLQRDKKGKIYFETVTNVFLITDAINKYSSLGFALPGTFIVKFEFTPNGFKLASIEVSNPLLKALVMGETVELTDNELITEMVKYEITNIYKCKNHGSRRRLVDEILTILLPLIEEARRFNNLNDLANLYAVMSSVNMIIQHPENQTLFINLQRIFASLLKAKNRESSILYRPSSVLSSTLDMYKFLVMDIEKLIETYQAIPDISHSLHFMASHSKRLATQKLSEPPPSPPHEKKTSLIKWPTVACIIMGATVGLFVAGACITLLLSSGTALPLFIATGTAIFAVAKAVGITAVTVSPATVGGWTVFFAITPVALAIGAECGHLFKKAVSGLLTLFRSKLSPAKEPLTLFSELSDGEADTKPEFEGLPNIRRDSTPYSPQTNLASEQRERLMPKQKASPSCFSKLFCCFFSATKKETVPHLHDQRPTKAI